MTYDKLSFISLESEVLYYQDRIQHTKDYLTYLESMHDNATTRMAQIAINTNLENQSE